MLQKLLIAFCAVALTACGGSLDLGPEYPPPVVEQPGPEEPGGSCETIAGQTFSFTFGEDEEVMAVSGDDAEHGTWFKNDSGSQILVEHDLVEERLVISPGSWPVEEQAAWRRQAHVRLQVDEEDVVLSNAQITAVMRIPGTYADQPGFSLELAAQTHNGGNYVNATRRFDNEENTLVADEEYTWVWEIEHMPGANAFAIGLHTAPDDLTILEPIYIYSVEIQLADEEICDEEPTIVELELDISAGWYVGDDIAGDDTPNPDAVVYTSEGASFTPTFEGQWAPKLFYLLDGPINLAGGTLTVEFTVEQAFLDAGASVTVLIQQNFPGFAQHKCNVSSTDLTAGESFTATCGDNPDAPPIPATMAADEGQSLRLGIELSNHDPGTDVGTVTIHKAHLSYYADGPGESDSGNGSLTITSLIINGSDYVVDDSGNWAIHDDPGATLDYEGGVVISPAFSGSHSPKLVYMVAGPIDLEGASLTVTFSVDQAFIDAGSTVQAIAQQNFGNYQDELCDAVTIDEAGSTLTATCENLPAFINAAEGQSLRMGLQITD